MIGLKDLGISASEQANKASVFLTCLVIEATNTVSTSIITPETLNTLNISISLLINLVVGIITIIKVSKKDKKEIENENENDLKI